MKRKTIGKIKYKLAEKLCQLTGWLLCAEDFSINNPMERHYRDVCAWDIFGTVPNSKIKCHIYSWDTMADCVKYGVVTVTNLHDGIYDIEVCRAENAEVKLCI